MISVLAFLWIAGSILFALLFGFAVIRLGGFQNYADLGNSSELSTKKMTGISVQWHLVYITLFWPVALSVAIYSVLTHKAK